eukprot:4855696-Pyramimonas_sp.AAC.1
MHLAAKSNLDHAQPSRDHCQVVLTGTAGVVARGLLCAGPADKMMGVGFRQGWRGPTCFPMCTVMFAGAPDSSS